MSETRILLLGLIAGSTIFLGLPIGRMRRAAPGLRHFLSALATGILIFLIWDVFSHAYAPIDTALANLRNHTATIWPVFGYASLFFLGTGVGLLSLVYYERFLARHKPQRTGPGAMAVTELTTRRWRVSTYSPSQRLAFLVAVGIGLHNFGEGLAIGGSAVRGEISLATLLVIGFALHNATEGFGIVAPMSAAAERPSWPFLLGLGLIGGGPTFAGTLIGSQFSSNAMRIIFLTLAAGSILYVVVQLLNVAQRANRPVLIMWGIFAGVTAGFLTDMIVTAGGA
jgi:ZIP family zinc transporter